MTDILELSPKEIKSIFDAMGEEMATHGREFIFTQLRVSAEHFVVPLCGIAAERTIRSFKTHQFHVYFEKKFARFKQGPVDLVLVPITSDEKDDLDNAYCFEFKMVWINGLQQNLTGIKKDIEKLGGYNRGFIVAILFSFDRKQTWAPYSHVANMADLYKKVILNIGEPLYEGLEYSISNHEATGKLKLVAWATNE